MAFVQQHMCALILAMLLLDAASPQTSFILTQRRLVRPTHCFAARALQDQLPFHAQTSMIIYLPAVHPLQDFPVGWWLR